MNTDRPAIHSLSNRTSPYLYSVVQGALADRVAETKDNDPLQNHLLAGLPEEQLNKLLPSLERVEMPAGQIIYEYGSRAQYVYFPATSIVSLIYEMEDGASAEVAIVGNEGIVGVGLFMAGETMPGLAQVQCAGFGYRLSSRILKEEFDRAGPLQRALLCYTQALIVEIAQNMVCNRHHSISKQLCRCLLLSLDRSASNEMALTHEMIGISLGVRRECVTVAAGKLRAAGLIDYKRGHITVLDRECLEARSCECYGIVKQTFERLLPRGVATGSQGDADGPCSGQSRFHPSHRPLRTNDLHAMK